MCVTFIYARYPHHFQSAMLARTTKNTGVSRSLCIQNKAIDKVHLEYIQYLLISVQKCERALSAWLRTSENTSPKILRQNLWISNVNKRSWYCVTLSNSYSKDVRLPSFVQPNESQSTRYHAVSISFGVGAFFPTIANLFFDHLSIVVKHRSSVSLYFFSNFAIRSSKSFCLANILLLPSLTSSKM